MGVHPVCAAEAQREVVFGAAVRRNGWPGNARDAVLLPRRRQAVPVDQAWLVESVFHLDAKALADIGDKPGSAIRLADTEHGSGLAVHLDDPPLQLKDDGRRVLIAWSQLRRGLRSHQPRQTGRGRQISKEDSAAR